MFKKYQILEKSISTANRYLIKIQYVLFDIYIAKWQSFNDKNNQCQSTSLSLGNKSQSPVNIDAPHSGRKPFTSDDVSRLCNLDREKVMQWKTGGRKEEVHSPNWRVSEFDPAVRTGCDWSRHCLTVADRSCCRRPAVTHRRNKNERFEKKVCASGLLYNNVHAGNRPRYSILKILLLLTVDLAMGAMNRLQAYMMTFLWCCLRGLYECYLEKGRKMRTVTGESRA